MMYCFWGSIALMLIFNCKWLQLSYNLSVLRKHKKVPLKYLLAKTSADVQQHSTCWNQKHTWDAEYSMTNWRHVTVVWCEGEMFYITITPDWHDRGYCSSKPPHPPQKNIHATQVAASDSSRPMSIEVLTCDPPGPMRDERVSHLCQLVHVREFNEWVVKPSCTITERKVVLNASDAFECFW